ncbi:MAG: cytochrome c oxidase subunit II [bacterium]
MDGWAAFGVFLVLGLAWTAAWAFVVARSGGPPLTYEQVSQGASRLRRLLAVAILLVLAVAYVLSVRWFPYPSFALQRLGPPAVVVEVRARQWAWDLSRTEIPANQPVEFATTAVDVNHGFGVYSPSGRLVAQVQAMPTYVNRLVLSFPEPGTYTIRCLEFCGIPHHGMVATFEVK